jgi:hypothetical protein
MAAPAIPPIRLGLIGTGLAVGKLHWPALRRFTGTPWRQYRGGVHHIAQIRLLCGDIARVHGAVQAANSTIDAPSDLVFTGGAIGNYTASNPEIPAPPEPVPVPGQRISSSASFAA